MPRRLAHLITLTFCVLAAAALPAPPHARAQDRTRTPSANELWNDYPLDQGEPAPAQSAGPSPARSAGRTAPADDSGSGQTIAALLAVVAAVAAAAATGTLLLGRRRRQTPPAAGARPATPPAVPRLVLAGPGNGASLLFSASGRRSPPSEASVSQARGDPMRERPGVRPPDPARGWTAEVRWQHSGDESRFCVVARDDQRVGPVTVIARSEPLGWPPEDANGVQALVSAVDALGEALTVAGWKPLASGTAWYEKRFEWVPSPAPKGWAPPRPGGTAAPVAPPPPPTSAGAAPAKRFRRADAWPAGTEQLWRCELRWRSGYSRSRFEVVMHDPVRGGSDRVIGRSAPFKWMLMGDPDPSSAAFRDSVRGLVAALESAGWEPVGAGTGWYAARFVWRGDGPPADDIEVAPANAHRAS